MRASFVHADCSRRLHGHCHSKRQSLLEPVPGLWSLSDTPTRFLRQETLGSSQGRCPGCPLLSNPPLLCAHVHKAGRGALYLHKHRPCADRPRPRTRHSPASKRKSVEPGVCPDAGSSRIRDRVVAKPTREQKGGARETRATWESNHPGLLILPQGNWGDPSL